MLVIQLPIVALILRLEWRELEASILRRANDRPFALQMFANRNPARIVCVADISALASDGLKVSEADILPSGVFQRMTPNVMLIDQGSPLEQVFLSPGDRFFSHRSGSVDDGRLVDPEFTQRIPFWRGQLIIPRSLQPRQSQVANLRRTLAMRDVLPNGRDVLFCFFRFSSEQFLCFLVNLPMSLGELFDQGW